MSSVIVEVVRIEAIRPHTNADKLFLAQIKGWQTVIRKLDNGAPEFQVGDCVVYIPPDSTLPRELVERFVNSLQVISVSAPLHRLQLGGLTSTAWQN